MVINMLEEFAAERGIAAGWAPAAADRKLEALLAKREEQGLAAPFVRWSPRRRANPFLLNSAVKTVVSIAVPYVSDYFPKPEDVPRGRIARFSWGEDYHGVVRTYLEQAASLCRKEMGARSLAFNVDNEPLVDRYWANTAGIGWYGANTALFTERYGSWVALGEVLLDITIDETKFSSRPNREDCSQCGRCIAVCPTGALEQPFLLNPYKCLSYLTQQKGVFPRQYRSQLADRVYGCDACQEVCPKNRKAQAGSLPQFRAATENVPYPVLDQLLAMSNKEFQTIYGAAACGWRGKTLLQRNALIACANLGYYPEIMDELLVHDSAMLRTHAYWAYYKLAGNRSKDVLYRRSKVERDIGAEQELQWCLRHL